MDPRSTFSPEMNTQGDTTIMMQGEDYITYLHQTIFALETNYGAAIAINQQLQHHCEKAAYDILNKEEGMNERDEMIVRLQCDLYEYMKVEDQLKKELSKRQNLSEGWEKRASQLEAEQRAVKDLLMKRANAQAPMELMKEKNKLQKALQESKQQCDAVEEQLSKQLAEKEERHQLELSETAEKFRRELAEQAEKFRQDLLDKDELISEKEACLREVFAEKVKLSEQQSNKDGNVQPQELLTEKETQKKKSFWRRLFSRKKRTA